MQLHQITEYSPPIMVKFLRKIKLVYYLLRCDGVQSPLVYTFTFAEQKLQHPQTQEVNVRIQPHFYLLQPMNEQRVVRRRSINQRVNVTNHEQTLAKDSSALCIVFLSIRRSTTVRIFRRTFSVTESTQHRFSIDRVSRTAYHNSTAFR